MISYIIDQASFYYIGITYQRQILGQTNEYRCGQCIPNEIKAQQFEQSFRESKAYRLHPSPEPTNSVNEI
ncbi:hypothetical protein DERP_004869 [Dermatophagoides pteronyssinus]|uniref:Uncharacterized protein n=1 Tax=Dermatophagoides pteronyssinus TaxID=6956 RepID=A0ABQ8JSR0_DERPT|nr:hypothetical protein DERP_004869 [Dermatophagoides pteronyssinus]